MGTRRKKKRVGRPPRPPEQVRRNRITSTFTDRELADLQRRAEKASLPVAKVIHRALAEALGWLRWR